jgi:hypothetical protein
MDEKMKHIIEQEFIRKPSVGFSDKVMKRIFELPRPVRIEPIITYKGWFFIAGFTILVFATIFYTYSPSEQSKYVLLQNWNSTINMAIEKLFSFSTEYSSMLIAAVVLLSMFVLLAFDFAFGSKRRVPRN